MDKKKIEIIYSQLIAIKEETPSSSDKASVSYDSSFWERYNTLVDSLNTLTNNDYSDFKITPRSSHHNGRSAYWVEINTFRQRVGSLIGALHAEFLADTPHPYQKNTQPMLTQSFNQTTNIEILMTTVLQIQEQIIKKEDNYPKESAERGFINKLKDVLKGIKNVNEAILLILQLANTYKVPLEKLMEIFS